MSDTKNKTTPQVVEKPKQLTPEEIAEAKRKLEETVETAESNLERAIFQLLTTEPFLGHLMQQLTRLTSLQIPTACVSVVDNRYSLTINPFFFNELETKERVAVLKHELCHLLNEHLHRGQDRDPKIFNVGADMAINQWIQNLPTFDHAKAVEKLMESGLTKEEAESKLPKPDANGRGQTCLLPKDYNLPNDKTAEWYYEAILNDPNLKEKFQQKKVILDMENGMTNLSPEEQKQLAEDIKNGKVQVCPGQGDHSQWGSTEGQTKEVLDEELKRIIRESMEKSGDSFGNLPGMLQEQIRQFLTTKVSWKTKLRSFIQRATHVLRINSRQRPSRRYGISFPGQKSNFKLNLCVFIDSSGSIGEDESRIFGGEINRLLDTKLADITLVWGDTKVQKVEQLTKKLEPNKFVMYGRGGTDAGPWLHHIDKEGYDAAVILTDGYFSHDLKKPKTLLLWALSEGGYQIDDFRRSVPFGKIIKLELDEKARRRRYR